MATTSSSLIEMGDRHNEAVGAAAMEKEKERIELQRRIRGSSWSGGEVAYCCQKLQNISSLRRRTKSEGDRWTAEEVDEESRYDDECVIHLRFVGGFDFELKNITAETIHRRALCFGEFGGRSHSPPSSPSICGWVDSLAICSL